jgi:hypothetical protein
MKLRYGVLAVLVGGLTVIPSVTALATQPDPNHKVTICHRTHSAGNPYVIITVDEAAINADTGDDNGKGDHQTHNEGPVPNPPTTENFAAVKAAGGWWGDIIPPFYENGDPGYWPSLNWDANGQAVFENGCKPTNYPAVPVSGELASSTTGNDATAANNWLLIGGGIAIGVGAFAAGRKVLLGRTK